MVHQKHHHVGVDVSVPGMGWDQRAGSAEGCECCRQADMQEGQKRSHVTDNGALQTSGSQEGS